MSAQTPPPLPSLSRLRGMELCDPDGERLGTVRDAFLAPDLREVRYLAVSVGRVSRERHAIPLDQVAFVDDGVEEYVTVPFSADHLRGAPILSEHAPMTAARERAIAAYYERADDWEAARESVRAARKHPAPTPQIAQATMADALATGRTEPRVVDPDRPR